MDARKLKHEALLGQWREKIVACRSSGMAVSRWCREQGVTAKTYYRWEREVLAEAGKQVAVRETCGSPAFVEVSAAPQEGPVMEAGHRMAARLHTAVGAIDVYTGADRGTLQAIIEALKDAE